MAFEVEIKIGNSTIRIAASGGQSKIRKSGGSTSSANLGGNGPIDPEGPGGGGPSAGGGACCPLVIGPIVISGASGGGAVSGASLSGQDYEGGNGPIDPEGPGGGGPGGSSGAAQCSPVVIGPIVFGCCSSEGTTGSNALPTAKAITLDPPIQPRTANGKVFAVPPQEESNWCWAAVGVAINSYLSNPAVPLTQGRLASQVVEAELGLGAGQLDCTGSPLPRKCNRPEGLDEVLKITGNLSNLGARFNKYLTFDSIRKWADTDTPIAARIVWDRGGAHFVALDGYRELATGEQMVHVQDPLYESGFQLYDDLVNNYLQLSTGGGRWQDTYLVQP